MMKKWGVMKAVSTFKKEKIFQTTHSGYTVWKCVKFDDFKHFVLFGFVSFFENLLIDF